MGNAQKPGAKAAQAAAQRAERLAEQLRANLKRRKAAAKERTGMLANGAGSREEPGDAAD